MERPDNVVQLYPSDDDLPEKHRENVRLFREAKATLGSDAASELLELCNGLDPDTRSNIFNTAYDLTVAGHDFSEMKNILTLQIKRYQRFQK